MSNIKVVYDCEKQTTSYVPLSGAEIAERAAQIAARAAAEAAQEIARAEQAAAAEALAVLKSSARAKLVANEPLTEEEAATIVL